MTDKNDKPVVSFVVLQSVEDYVEKSGKFRTECAFFEIPDSGGANAVYIPYCHKHRFDFGPALNEYRGQGAFTPPEMWVPISPVDFELFRAHFHDIHCPPSCKGYRNKRIVALLNKLRPRGRGTGTATDGKWTRKEIITAVVVPFIVLLIGTVLAWMTPEGRRWLHLDKPQLERHASSPSVSSTKPQTDSTPAQPSPSPQAQVETWSESEGTRPSNVWHVDYNGTFSCPSQEGIPAFCTATRSGNKISVHRFESLDGNKCDFQGTVSGNSVTGVYSCLSGMRDNALAEWKAEIAPAK